MNKRIAIIGAMESEIDGFLKELSQVKKNTVDNFVFHEGILFGKEVVIAKSGVGKVFAAMLTQKIIDLYNPQAVIMTGVAGALKADFKIGDIVISKDCIQHDMDAIAIGFPRGTIPYTDYRVFSANEKLINLGLQAKMSEHMIIAGRVLTGDQFPTEKQTIEKVYLFDELAGDVIEMEGAALGQVCVFNKIPFVIIRTICSELHGNQEEQFKQTLPLVAKNSLTVIQQMLHSY